MRRRLEKVLEKLLEAEEEGKQRAGADCTSAPKQGELLEKSRSRRAHAVGTEQQLHFERHQDDKKAESVRLEAGRRGPGRKRLDRHVTRSGHAAPQKREAAHEAD